MTPIAALACALAIADWGPIRVDAEGVPLPPGVLARIGSTRMRHDGWLSEIHFSPDGRRILGIHEGNLSTWDARTGRRLRLDTLPSYLHCTSAFRADGRLLFVASVQDGTRSEIRIRAIDVETGIDTTVLRFEDGSPYLSADGTRVAVRSNGYVRVSDTRTGKFVGETRLSISDYDPLKVVFSPDGKLLAAVYAGWLEVREIATGNVAYSGVPAGRGQFRNAVFSPDGRELCCVVENDKFVVDAVELKTEKRVQLTECDTFYHPTYARDGQTLYGIRNSELVRIDRATKAVTLLGKGFSRATATPLVLSPDGAALAVGGIRYRLTLHDPKTGRRLPPNEDRFEAAGSTIEFSADGTKLAFNSDGEDDGHLVDVATGRISKTVQYHDTSCRFLPSGNEYVVASAKSLEVRTLVGDRVRWNAAIEYPWAPSLQSTPTGKTIFTFGPTQSQSWELGVARPSDLFRREGFNTHFSPDARYAVVYSPNVKSKEDRRVALIDLTTGKEHPRWPKITDRVEGVFFDPHGQMVALFVEGGGRLLIVDLKTFEVRHVSSRVTVGLCPPAFSIDSRMLAVCDSEDRDVHLFELTSGKRRQTIRVTDLSLSLAFSPNNRVLAVHSTTAPVHLYDLHGVLLNLPKHIDRDSLSACWKSLNSNDAEESFHALRQMAAAGEWAVPFIRERVRAAVGSPKETVAGWIDSLDAPDFADREKATAELRRIADIIEADLRAAEQATPSAEVKQRLEKILASLRPDSPESVRRSRVVEVVEWCGTPDAKKLLQEWAAGAPTAALTREAKEALARWRP